MTLVFLDPFLRLERSMRVLGFIVCSAMDLKHCRPISVVASASRGFGRALKMRAIKCLKGVRWMPWHAQAMKDVVRCEKPWGAANKL